MNIATSHCRMAISLILMEKSIRIQYTVILVQVHPSTHTHTKLIALYTCNSCSCSNHVFLDVLEVSLALIWYVSECCDPIKVGFLILCDKKVTALMSVYYYKITTQGHSLWLTSYLYLPFICIIGKDMQSDFQKGYHK